MSDEIEDPPEEYDYEPTKPYHLLRVPSDKVERYCRGIERACAIPRRRVIVIDEAITGELYDRILRHEKAHLNGWIH